ncbi:oligosaccharide flippase family protein [Baekduia sp. Peel2402]|uniref:oligosaccharide flippase family protein n=1 Tax=Baekduia sp. Peel2402 TaxID=3458296 RepID=UPI00403E7CF6
MTTPDASSGDARSRGDLEQAAVSGARWITLARIAAEVVLFATLVVLAHLIPPAAFGRYAIVIFMTELSVGVIGGFGQALVQRPSIDISHQRAAMAIVMLIQGTLVVATWLVLAPYVIEPIFGHQTADLVKIASPAFLLAGLMTVPQAMLQRRLDFRRLGQLQVASTLAGAAVQLGLAVAFDLDAEALVLGTVAATAVACLVAVLSSPPPLPRLGRGAGKELSTYGTPAAIAAISWAGFRNVDYAIVGARLGAASAGIYWRAFQLAVEYQKKISVIVYQVAFPVLARAASVEDMLALRLRMVRLLTLLVFPLLAGLVALAPTVVPFVFGDEWTAAVGPTQILAIAGAATLVIDAVGATLMATGRARAMLGYGWAHFAVYAGVVLAVSSHGIMWVASAAAAVHVVFLVVAYYVLLHGRPEKPLRHVWDDVAPALVGSLALVAVAFPVRMGLDDAGLPAGLVILVVGAASVPAYLLAVRVLFPAIWHENAPLVARMLPARLRRRPPVAPAPEPVDEPGSAPTPEALVG